MAFFNQVQAAQAAGREVILDSLVEFDLTTGPMRLWTGSGILNFEGHEWIGSGVLGSISAMPFGENDAADKVTFQLSGVTPELVTASNNTESVRGRAVTICGLFFDAATSQPLDSKFLIRSLIMDTIGYRAKGPAGRQITLTAETLWTARNLAAYSYWSDRDQKARFPGDRGCEFIPTLKNKKVTWPTF
jgi:hypothetical protein